MKYNYYMDYNYQKNAYQLFNVEWDDNDNADWNWDNPIKLFKGSKEALIQLIAYVKDLSVKETVIIFDGDAEAVIEIESKKIINHTCTYFYGIDVAYNEYIDLWKLN